MTTPQRDASPDPLSGFRQRGGAPVIFRPTPCGHCGYELLGLPQSGWCPECGTRIGEDAPDSRNDERERPPPPPPQTAQVSVPKCHRCGYDLSGLRSGSVCPECGEATTRVTSVSKRDTLGDADPEYLWPLTVGLMLTGLSGIVFGALMLNWAALNTGVIIVAHVGLAAAWFGGVLLLLRQRPGGGVDRDHDALGREWWLQRQFVAWTQAAVVPGCVFVIMAQLGTSPWGGWWWMFGLCVTVALVGWPVLCYYMSRLADWASDDSLSAHFRHTGSFIGAGTAVSAIAFLARLYQPLGILAFFLSVLVIASPLACLYMCILLLRSAVMVAWARRNTLERYDRDARMIERSRRRADEMTARSLAMTGFENPPPAEIDAELLRGVEESNARAQGLTEEEEAAARLATFKHVHTIQPLKEGAGYAVEGE